MRVTEALKIASIPEATALIVWCDMVNNVRRFVHALLLTLDTQWILIEY
ncbi:MAG: hypothetical protein MK081_13995 [Flavobacteriales bacterium]|nr:hypothetical protein [Flavobacteriales bacterium]